MQQDVETVLRFSKEIIIKFIELGRVSPIDFEQQFKSVFWTIKQTVVDAQLSDLASLEAKKEEEGKEP